MQEILRFILSPKITAWNLFLIVLVLVIRRLKKSSHKKKVREIGEVGESKVYFKLKEMFPTAKFLNNLYIPYERGKGSCEIDLVMIHPTGIYCFECKNYSGNIVGNLEDNFLTGHFNKGKAYKIYNPIKQNNKHVFNLRRITKGKYFIYSCVVFVRNIGLPNSSNINLEFFGTLSQINKLKSSIQQKPALLNTKEMNKLYRDLNVYCNASKKEKKEHIKYVNKCKKRS